MENSQAHLSNGVDHRQVPEAHCPEEVENLRDVGVGRDGEGGRVHVGGDILSRGTRHTITSPNNSGQSYNTRVAVVQPSECFKGFTYHLLSWGGEPQGVPVLSPSPSPSPYRCWDCHCQACLSCGCYEFTAKMRCTPYYIAQGPILSKFPTMV